MIEVSKAFSEKQETWSKGYREGLKDALTALESLENEYKAYHTTLYPTGQDSDYWRGIRYALDVLEGRRSVRVRSGCDRGEALNESKHTTIQGD